MCIITKHALERMQQRLGIPKKSCQRMADKALKEGVTHKEVNGSLSRYIDGLFLQNTNANQIRIYGSYVYIFSNGILITVIPLPNKFKSIVKKIVNKRKEV